MNEAVIAREVTPQEREKADELHLRLINGEYSEEYAEHIATSDKDGYTAGEFLKAYVRRLHKTGNWKQIATHAHRDSLSWYWLTVLRDDLNPSKFFDEEDSAPTPEIKIDREELAALFELAFNSPHEDDLWHLVGLVWDGRFLPPLLERMKQRTDSEKVRVAALRCLLLFAPDEFKAICENLRTDETNNRLVEIGLDVAHLEKHVSGLSKRHKEPGPDITAAMQQLSPAAMELALAFTELLHNRKPAIGKQAHNLLFSIRNASEDMQRLRLALSKAYDKTWQQDVDALLLSATEDDIAVEAVQAAARVMQVAALEQALTHKFARVRGAALEAIAIGLAAPLPARLLEMASDKGQYVRRTLGELLAKKVHPSHFATLMKLVRDNYSTGNHYSEDQAHFPIARAAVKAITEYSPLSPKVVDELSEVAISSGDVALRSSIFDILATHAGADGQQMLFQLATEPGRNLIRGQAAAALLSAFGSAHSGLVANITAELLSSQPGNVAASLALLLGAEGEFQAIERAANALAANSKRRVLVLLLIHAVNGRSPELAPKLAALLPSDHLALEWALGGDIDWEDDKPLSDLGERSICKEVFVFMQPSRQKPGPDLVG